MKSRLFWMDQASKCFAQSISVKEQIIQHHLDTIVDIAMVIANSIESGGRLLLCGNGGSLADAQHLAAELLIRLRSSCNRQPLGALCLAMDMSSVTACGNDYGFDDIFSRPLEAMGRPNDVLLGITTSGKSANVIKALKKARKMGITTVGFLAGAAIPALDDCDHAFIVPSTNTARIQESHITAGHTILEMVEDILEESGYLKRC
jgi:D-sedoheptulose 7-phosphate isomerase